MSASELGISWRVLGVDEESVWYEGEENLRVVLPASGTYATTAYYVTSHSPLF